MAQMKTLNGYEIVDASARANKLGAVSANGHYGMAKPDGTTSDWIRTTSSGIIPYQSGSNSALGTSSWKFKNAYIDTVYGSLSGNASTASKLATSRTISLTGSVTGSGSFDGSGNLSISTSTNHSHNYAGSSSAGGNANWANGATYANYSYNDKPITTAGTGAAYTASVSGLTLVVGASFVMVPHTVSNTTAPTLNVNSLGAKNIRMRISSSTSSTTALPSASFLTANKPVRLMYDGTYWIIDDMVRPDANNTYGTLISSGTAAPTSSNNGYIYIQYG